MKVHGYLPGEVPDDVAFVTEGLDPEYEAARARLQSQADELTAEVARANAEDPAVDRAYRKHLALLVAMGSTPAEAHAILTRRRAEFLAEQAGGTTPVSADEAYDALVRRAQARTDALRAGDPWPDDRRDREQFEPDPAMDSTRPWPRGPVEVDASLIEQALYALTYAGVSDRDHATIRRRLDDVLRAEGIAP